MAGLAFVKWLLPLAVGGAVGLFFWSGMSVLVFKTVLLWILISFGFLTLIFHASGSSLLGLIRRILGAEGDVKPKQKLSNDELVRRRQRSLLKKQSLNDDKSQEYQQNVMQPKQEAELLKKQAEIQKFHPNWKGEGHRLGRAPAEHICTCGQSHPIDTDDGDSLLDYIEDSQTESEQEETVQSTPATVQYTNTNNENMLRQRKKDISNTAGNTAIAADNTKNQSLYLNEEPALGSSGTITVALRCPNGETKKRRFHVDYHVQSLVDFAESLGFPSQQYCIMTTYPRKPLPDAAQTLMDAGLTQDVVLVIDDKEEER